MVSPSPGHCAALRQKKLRKERKGVIFSFLREKQEEKPPKGKMRDLATENAKFAKSVKMANRTCNGRDKKSVRYGSCYAACEVLTRLESNSSFTSQRFQDVAET